MGQFNVYGPQAFTAGTFTVTTPVTSDGNYPEIIYFEEVKTVDAIGPNGERILDSDDYGVAALTLYNLATLGADADYIDFWNDGAGIYLEIDAKFSSDVAADVGTAAIMSMGNRRDSPESFRKNFGLDIDFGAGEMTLFAKGDGTSAAFDAALTADDLWYTIRVYLLPSSDNGTTGDGTIRVWRKLSTDPEASFVLTYENTASFLWSSPFIGAPLNGQNYVNIGRFTILPSTNFRIFTLTDAIQAVVIGRAETGTATVTSDLTVLLNLDDAARTIYEPNTLYVAGNMIVTGTTTFTGDIVTSSPETLMNSMVTTGSELVVDSSGNIVFVNGS